MPDKPTIATHVLMLAAACFAAFLQLGLILTLGEPAERRKMAGALIVAGVLGGCGTALGQELLHWPSFVAGVAGTLVGMIPAAVSASTITKTALKKAGLENQDVKDMLEIMREAAKRQPGNAPAVPTAAEAAASEPKGPPQGGANGTA